MKFNTIEGKYWDTLGEYNYMFLPPPFAFDGKKAPGLVLAEVAMETGFPFNYNGKGVMDRASHHEKEKGYDLDHCYLVAINLEKFKGKPSLQNESYTMALYGKGADNKVNGHHMECFPFVKLSDHYAEWKQGQRDVKFEALDFLNNYDLGTTRLNFSGTSVNAHVTSETVKHRRGNIKIFWRNNNPKITIVRYGYASQHDDFMKEVSPDYTDMKISEWKGENGGAQPNGFCFEVDDQDTAFKYWEEFHN